MSFPTVLSRTKTGDGTNAAASTSVSVGFSSPASGDLLLAVLSIMENADFPLTLPTGWVQLSSTVERTGSQVQVVAYKVCTGSEGTSAVFTATGAVQFCAIAYLIQSGTYSSVPVISTAAKNGTANPNPPLLSSGFGVSDTLWLAVFSTDHNENSVTAWPSGYNNTGSLYHGGSFNLPVMGYAEATATTASEDPGAFTLNTAREWIANTIAIQGLATATSTPAFGRYGVRGPVR